MAKPFPTVDQSEGDGLNTNQQKNQEKNNDNGNISDPSIEAKIQGNEGTQMASKIDQKLSISQENNVPIDQSNPKKKMNPKSVDFEPNFFNSLAEQSKKQNLQISSQSQIIHSDNIRVLQPQQQLKQQIPLQNNNNLSMNNNGNSSNAGYFLSYANNIYNIVYNDNSSFKICFKQPYKSTDQYGIVIENVLKQFASTGNLLVKWQQFENEFKKQMLQQYQIQDINTIQQILQENLEVYHQTMRKFGETDPIFYVSIKLDTISIESIYWIIYSIRRDMMTPTDKVIYSRIKECFGVPMKQNEWNEIIKFFKSLTNQKSEIYLKDTPMIFPTLKLKKSKDPLNNQEFNLIYIKDTEWITEDQGPISAMDNDSWILFIDFVKEFFNEDNKQIWISSVVNIHTQNPKKSQVKLPKGVTKAIPGGRYGCAQFVKCCGNQKLRKQSLGKLLLFSQEAITKGYLVFYKTLLIKGQFDEDYKDQAVQQGQERKQKIEQVKQVILNILKGEPQNGVTLARLPKLIDKELDYDFNIQELGYLKLKNLLKEIEGVWIEKDGTIQACAFFSEEAVQTQRQLVQIKKCVKEIIKENQGGIQGEEILIQILKKMQIQFLDFAKYGCLNLCDFLQKKCGKLCTIQTKLGSQQNNFTIFPYQAEQYQKHSSCETYESEMDLRSQGGGRNIEDLIDDSSTSIQQQLNDGNFISGGSYRKAQSAIIQPSQMPNISVNQNQNLFGNMHAPPPPGMGPPIKDLSGPRRKLSRSQEHIQLNNNILQLQPEYQKLNMNMLQPPTSQYEKSKSAEISYNTSNGQFNFQQLQNNNNSIGFGMGMGNSNNFNNLGGNSFGGPNLLHQLSLNGNIKQGVNNSNSNNFQINNNTTMNLQQQQPQQLQQQQQQQQFPLQQQQKQQQQPQQQGNFMDLLNLQQNQ